MVFDVFVLSFVEMNGFINIVNIMINILINIMINIVVEFQHKY